MDCSPLGSSIHGIFQARVLEWVAISFSRRCAQPRDLTQFSHIAGIWATREAQMLERHTLKKQLIWYFYLLILRNIIYNNLGGEVRKFKVLRSSEFCKGMWLLGERWSLATPLSIKHHKGPFTAYTKHLRSSSKHHPPWPCFGTRGAHLHNSLSSRKQTHKKRLVQVLGINSGLLGAESPVASGVQTICFLKGLCGLWKSTVLCCCLFVLLF